MPNTPFFIHYQLLRIELTLLIQTKTQIPITINIIENDWWNSASNIILFSPKLCIMLVGLCLLIGSIIGVYFEVFIELSDKFGIFYAVGIYERSLIIKIEQTLKIYEKIVLILDECLHLKLGDIDQKRSDWLDFSVHIYIYFQYSIFNI